MPSLGTSGGPWSTRHRRSRLSVYQHGTTDQAAAAPGDALSDGKFDWATLWKRLSCKGSHPTAHLERGLPCATTSTWQAWECEN